MAPERQYDVVVWGASGFTGRLVCEHIARHYQGQIKWAMAGRHNVRVQEVRDSLCSISQDVADVPVLVADSQDAGSLQRMAAATKVLISAVGPYSRLGRLTVQACIDSGTHYCDLCGEPDFMQHCVESFHEAAKARRVRIVHACGFDCVPSDMLALMIAHHLRERHGKAVGDMITVTEKGMSAVSGGTVDSILGMVAGMSHGRLLPKIADPYALARAAYTERYGERAGSMPDRGMSLVPLRSKITHRWSGPSLFDATDAPVVRRSAALLGYGDNMKYQERLPADSYWAAWLGTLLHVCVMVFAFVASRFALVRALLPKPGQGPSREVMESGCLLMKSFAYSWEPDSEQAPVRVRASFQDRHRDPGYLGASRMILEAAMCLALQQDELAQDAYAGQHAGGVLTPASALGMVYLERLQRAGFDADVLELEGAPSSGLRVKADADVQVKARLPTAKKATA